MKEKKRHGRRVTAFLLSVVTALTTIFSSGLPVLAADGTIQFNSGENIYYGDYVTAKMTFDGDNVAYCVEPLKKTPQAGTYSYNLLATDSPVRKAVYYLPGGYGYDANIKDQYLSGWSEDHAYVIEEQRCEANEGMNLLKIEVTVYRDSVTIDLGTLTDDRIEIGTTALDQETGSHLSNPDQEVTLIDTVEYEGLKKGEESGD